MDDTKDETDADVYFDTVAEQIVTWLEVLARQVNTRVDVVKEWFNDYLHMVVDGLHRGYVEEGEILSNENSRVNKVELFRNAEDIKEKQFNQKMLEVTLSVKRQKKMDLFMKND